MKRIILIVAAGMLLSVLSVHSAWAFGVKDVVKMHQAGIPDSLIVQKIEYSGHRFDLSASDITKLKDAGVSNTVISVMLRTEAESRPYGYYPRYYNDYYGWPWSNVNLGLGLDYYGFYHTPYFYAPYYAPYYAPRFGFRRFGHRGFVNRGFRDHDFGPVVMPHRGFVDHDGGRAGGFVRGRGGFAGRGGFRGDHDGGGGFRGDHDGGGRR